MKRVLVTGSCGFIGYHLCKYLCSKGYDVFGIDNLQNKKEVKLVKKRLENLKKEKNFRFYKLDLSNKDFKQKIKNFFFEAIIHLAAKPGVRESIKFPNKYFDSNIVSFFNIIEFSKKASKVFIYASSSSVYGNNQELNNGSKESYTKINPISFYALTKEINEIIGNYYSRQNNLKCFGLRFFSVYGTYGRPDMAYYKFPLYALKKKAIELNNSGNDLRDFTHVLDLVHGIEKLIIKSNSIKENEVFNIGSNAPIQIKKLLELIKIETNMKLRIKNLKKNLLDPFVTNADISRAKKVFGYEAKIKFEEGYKDFLKWFLLYHKN